jgi:hypothetical protein
MQQVLISNLEFSNNSLDVSKSDSGASLSCMGDFMLVSYGLDSSLLIDYLEKDGILR